MSRGTHRGPNRWHSDGRTASHRLAWRARGHGRRRDFTTGASLATAAFLILYFAAQLLRPFV